MKISNHPSEDTLAMVAVCGCSLTISAHSSMQLQGFEFVGSSEENGYEGRSATSSVETGHEVAAETIFASVFVVVVMNLFVC